MHGFKLQKVICAACQASSSTLDPIEDVGLEVSVDYPSGGPGDAAPAASSSTRTSRNASPLLPHGNASLADVQSAFQRFARVEQVDGYKCEKCGCTGRATKQSKLASIPPILTLHLKRFRYGDSRLLASGSAAGATSASYGASYSGAAGYSVPTVTTRSSRSGGRSEASQLNSQDFALGGKSGSAKIEGHVKFDLFFDLKPYLTPEMQTSVNSMFCRLFAVIVHAGKNSHSGHYIAYVQSLNKNEWWKMDDGRVTLVDKTDVLQAEAYMLFYRVIQHPVAVTLSNAYDNLLNARRAADPNPSQADALRADNRSSVADPKTSNGRGKRSRSTYRDGEAWARAKAPRMLGVATKAQEVVAEALDLTSDFLQRIQDEASRDGAREDYGGPTMVTEDDVVGGVSKVRQRLADLFYRLAQHFDDGSSSETPRPAFLDPMDSNGGGDSASVVAATAGSASTRSNNSNSNGAIGSNGEHNNKSGNGSIAMGKTNPKALTPKAAVGPSDKKSSVVVVDLMDDDANDVL
jgi:Ubiquitin carboxyl-terminal hydrolase